MDTKMRYHAPIYFTACLMSTLVFVVFFHTGEFGKERPQFQVKSSSYFQTLGNVTHYRTDSHLPKSYPNKTFSPSYSQLHTLKNIPKDQSNSTLPRSLIEFAKEVNKNGRVLILAVFNDGQVSMAHSWLCNTIYMGIHQQVLLVVADNKSRDELRHHWPAIHVEALPGELSSSGDHSYGKLGYLRLTLWRNLILFEFLKANIELLLCEMDALWIRNPLPETKRLTKDYDIAAVYVGNGNIGFGFMYIKPSKPIITLWQNFTEIFAGNVNKFRKVKNAKQKIAWTVNDQIFLSAMLRDHYAGVRMKVLSNEQFLDGRWYTSKNATAFRNGFILNNNFAVSNEVKIKRAKQFHHWFWENVSGRCNLALVNSTVLE